MGILSYILTFLAINLLINFVFQYSPIMGILLYAGFIYYAFFRPARRRMFRTQTRTNTTYGNPFQQPEQPQQNPNFRKDPNVIDAEFTEHKPYN